MPPDTLFPSTVLYGIAGGDTSVLVASNGERIRVGSAVPTSAFAFRQQVFIGPESPYSFAVALERGDTYLLLFDRNACKLQLDAAPGLESPKAIVEDTLFAHRNGPWRLVLRTIRACSTYLEVRKLVR